MAINVTLADVSSGFNLTTLNDNFTAIETAFLEAVSLAGTTPNSMTADLDLNSNDLLNGGVGNFDNIVVDGVDLTTSVAAAAASAAAAAASATAAGISEANAATSESNAAGSASAAATSASAASTSETNAATSETNASASASAAAASASSASTSETNAASSASSASTSASSASTSASNASTSEANAATSATNAAASYDQFDDRYLGDKASDPSLDNDGDALLTGALYFNTTVDEMRVYDGATWNASYLPAGDYLLKSGGTMSGVIDNFTSTGIDDNATSTAMTIDSAGNVGIGTTTPSQRLDVSGNIHLSNTPNVFVRLTDTDNNAYTSFVNDGGNLTIHADEGNEAASSYMRFFVDATEKVRITGAGDVGIGTTNPTDTLHVASASFPTLKLEDTTDTNNVILQHHTTNNTVDLVVTGAYPLTFKTNNTEAARFDASQNAIFNASGQSAVQFTGGSDVRLTLGSNGTVGNNTSNWLRAAGDLMRMNSSGDGYKFEINGGTTFDIDSSGNVGINNASPADIFEVGDFSSSGSTSGTLFKSGGFERNSSATVTSNAFHNVFYNPNGAVGSIITNGTATSYNVSSDYRIKENVVTLSDGIDRLKQLKPSRFNFIADPTVTVDGFIAHEVDVVVPEAVTGEKDAVDVDGDPIIQQMDASKLIPLLTAALQEAVTKIEDLEARVATLEGGA